MHMHVMACSNIFWSHSYAKGFIHKDAMSQHLDQVRSSGSPASHLHCTTKPDFRMSGCAPLPSYPLSLERYDPAHRIHQYYRLTVQPNLFGAWSLLRE